MLLNVWNTIQSRVLSTTKENSTRCDSSVTTIHIKIKATTTTTRTLTATTTFGHINLHAFTEQTHLYKLRLGKNTSIHNTKYVLKNHA